MHASFNTSALNFWMIYPGIVTLFLIGWAHTHNDHCIAQSLLIKFQTLRIKLHYHDDVIKWKHFPRYLPFVRGIHRSPVKSPHKGQWYGTLMFSLIWAWINCWVNNREAGDLRRHRAHHDVIAMYYLPAWTLAPPLKTELRTPLPLRGLASFPFLWLLRGYQWGFPYQISLVHHIDSSYQISLKFCKTYDSVTTVLCINFKTIDK